MSVKLFSKLIPEETLKKFHHVQLFLKLLVSFEPSWIFVHILDVLDLILISKYNMFLMSGEFLLTLKETALKQYFQTMGINMLLCQLDTRLTQKNATKTVNYFWIHCALCGDLNVVSMLLAWQNGYKIFSCFCEWHSERITTWKRLALRKTWQVGV